MVLHDVLGPVDPVVDLLGPLGVDVIDVPGLLVVIVILCFDLLQFVDEVIYGFTWLLMKNIHEVYPV